MRSVNEKTNPQSELSELLATLNATLMELNRRLETLPEPTNDKVYTVPTAAAFLNVKVQTIYNLLSRRALPSYKSGKRVYFKHADLIAFLESGKRNAYTPEN